MGYISPNRSKSHVHLGEVQFHPVTPYQCDSPMLSHVVITNQSYTGYQISLEMADTKDFHRTPAGSIPKVTFGHEHTYK